MECDPGHSRGSKRRRPSFFETYDANEPEPKRTTTYEIPNLAADDERLVEATYATHESRCPHHTSAAYVDSNQTSSMNPEKQYICFGTVRNFPFLFHIARLT